MKAVVNGAPPIVERLIDSFLMAPDSALIDDAYRAAERILRLREPQKHTEEVSNYVDEAATAYLQTTDPQLLDEESAFQRYGGSIQNAIQEPAFCIGFALAYLLFVEKGSARLENVGKPALSIVDRDDREGA